MTGTEFHGIDTLGFSRKPESMFYVICADGNTRHDDDFVSRHDASVWAEFGHICMRHHEIVRVEVSAREFDNLTWPKATPGSPGEAIRNSRLDSLHGAVK